MIYEIQTGSVLNSLWLLSAGILFAQVALSPSRNDAKSHGALNHRIKTYAKRSLLAFLLLSPMLFLGFVAGPLLLVPIFIGIVFTVASRRRLNQGKVLWTLALGVRSGSDLIRDLESIADSLSIGHRRKVMRLADRLFEGCTLDDALRRTPGVVPHDAVVAARAGAVNGTLSDSLRDAALRHNRRYGKISTTTFSPSMAVVYLLAVPFIGILILNGLMIYIVPKFKEIFEGFNTELPGLTVQLIDFSDRFAKYWYLFSPLFLLAFFGTILLSIVYIIGFGEFDFPVFKRAFRRLDLPNLLRHFATTVRQQRPLDETINSICATHKRAAIRQSMDDVYHLMRAGDDPWQAMRSQNLLSANETAALQSAERAGNLSWALEQLADSLERRLSYRWKTWLEFLQPGFVIALGIGVGFICLAMFLPLIKLLNDLS